jgi:hypothetical protein
LIDAKIKPITNTSAPSASMVMPTCLIAEEGGFELEDGI